jgi:3-hydroxybutyryl-CoA dehydrogenase
MEIKSIGVVGAGKMGSGIALSAAISGYHVIVHEKSEEDLARATAAMEAQLRRLIGKNTLSQEEGTVVWGRIATTSVFKGFDDSDFVIEVVPEILDLKLALLAELDHMCKKETILASNTSTLSITSLGAATNRPAQFVGMHFFIPPTKLVEVIRGYYTSDETIDQATKLARKMGRITVEVKKDSPGFIANRIYTPLFLEAFKAYEEGLASKEDIDLALKNSYLPIGPFELADIIGLDVLDAGFDYYQSQLGPAWNPSQTFKQLVRAGRIGKKVGKGWYDY